MESETCRTCGGDGRIGNALGRSTATCPSCHGSGRRSDTSSMFRDVTKTKPSHYQRPAAGPAVDTGPKGPTTLEGQELAAEVNASTVLTADAKARLVVEIMNHESSHGRCTKTFLKKIRKQARPPPAGQD
jgi:DnaJ-class molecular chaperone